MNFFRAWFGRHRHTETDRVPEPPSLLETPWREDLFKNIHDVDEIRNKVTEFVSGRSDVERVNVLLIGEVGSGKTSFYNTCITAVNNTDIKSPFHVRAGDSSATLKLQKADIGNGNKKIKLNLYDCRGLSNINGLRDEDLFKLIDGKIRKNYEFQQTESIQCDNKFYNNNASLGDMMHCIVYVVNASNPSEMLIGENSKKIMNAVLDKYGRQNIAQMVLMNRTDKLRVSVRKNPSEIFYSVEVWNKMRDIKDQLGLNANDILPMMNYTEETVPKPEIDILTLYNLHTIMKRAKDYLHYVAEEAENDDKEDATVDEEQKPQIISESS